MNSEVNCLVKWKLINTRWRTRTSNCNSMYHIHHSHNTIYFWDTRLPIFAFCSIEKMWVFKQRLWFVLSIRIFVRRNIGMKELSSRSLLLHTATLQNKFHAVDW